MIWPSVKRRIVRWEAGPQTCPGAGDYVIDDQGQRYRVISEYEARILTHGTAGTVCKINRDGTIG